MPSPGAGAGCAAAPHGWGCRSQQLQHPCKWLLQHHEENTTSSSPAARATCRCPSLVCLMFSSLTPDGLPRQHKPGSNAWSSVRGGGRRRVNHVPEQVLAAKNLPCRETTETLLSEIPLGSKTARQLGTSSGRPPHEKELPTPAP